MLSAGREHVEALPADASVLDVGGWAAPLARADWVIDLMGWETRGLYGSVDPADERFSAATWVQRDICAREPWPFADGAFDFVVCSHTLEDVRDPIWVCSELSRVARAGYVEVPPRLVEQSFGVQGDWVGWGHHHWLIDVVDGGLEFVFKPHILARKDLHFPAGFAASLRRWALRSGWRRCGGRGRCARGSASSSTRRWTTGCALCCSPGGMGERQR